MMDAASVVVGRQLCLHWLFTGSLSGVAQSATRVPVPAWLAQDYIGATVPVLSVSEMSLIQFVTHSHSLTESRCRELLVGILLAPPKLADKLDSSHDTLLFALIQHRLGHSFLPKGPPPPSYDQCV